MSSSTTITKTISQRRRSWGKGRTMAGESQKLKLLNLAKMLYERTDESHGLTCPEIIAGLAEAGIEAERKSVYRDSLVEYDSRRFVGDLLGDYCIGDYFSGRGQEACSIEELAQNFLAFRDSHGL